MCHCDQIGPITDIQRLWLVQKKLLKVHSVVCLAEVKLKAVRFFPYLHLESRCKCIIHNVILSNVLIIFSVAGCNQVYLLLKCATLSTSASSTPQPGLANTSPNIGLGRKATGTDKEVVWVMIISNTSVGVLHNVRARSMDSGQLIFQSGFLVRVELKAPC